MLINTADELYLSLSRAYSHSLLHTLPYFLSHSLTLPHSHILSLTLPHSYTHSLTHFHSFTHPHTLSILTHSPSTLPHSHIHSFSFLLTVTLSLTLTHAHSLSLTHLVRQLVGRPPRPISGHALAHLHIGVRGSLHPHHHRHQLSYTHHACRGPGEGTAADLVKNSSSISSRGIKSTFYTFFFFSSPFLSSFHPSLFTIYLVFTFPPLPARPS